MEKKHKLNLNELDTVVGGATGEPVEGAEILVQLDPEEYPIKSNSESTDTASGNKGGFAIGGYNPA